MKCPTKKNHKITVDVAKIYFESFSVSPLLSFNSLNAFIAFKPMNDDYVLRYILFDFLS